MTTPATETEAPMPGFRALLREDLKTHGGDRSLPGYKALRMYRFGVWRMTVRPRALRMPLSAIYRWMHRRVRNRYGIELHYTASVGRRVLIAHQGAIVIHERATIGDECIIRHGVTLGAAGQYSYEIAPVLEARVDVGAGAKILGKVRIGEGARIGANAVIMQNVPPGAIAVSPPARIIPPMKQSTG